MHAKPIAMHPSAIVGANAGQSTTSASTSTRALLLVFCSWKLLLLLLAVASPGAGYDTSTRILLAQTNPPHPDSSWLTYLLEHLVSRLTRWDGIYFATSSARGHVHEQEWAFSWVLARVTSAVARVVPFPAAVTAFVAHATVGIFISHISHFLAVLLLYQLTFVLIPSTQHRKHRIAFTAACLHILSPAGLFLSAPSAESPFALFNFLGMLAYVLGVRSRRIYGAKAALTASLWSLASSICFGQGAVLRSNGLLSGCIFAWDAVASLPHLPDILQSPARLLGFGATLASGIILALAFVAPQSVAYLEYCTAGNSRPWCQRLPPSIYTWVQEHYWNVGFLRYWTLSNLPLFLLAAPCIVLLVSTGIVALQGQLYTPASRSSTPAKAQAQAKNASVKADEELFRHVVARLALPQVMIATLATTSFHVQTINRISSGYPVWYIALAIAVHNDGAVSGPTVTRYLSRNAKHIVRAMVIYAIIQGALYASFLPPA